MSVNHARLMAAKRSLEKLTQLAKDYPLAPARLWTSKRTSQRDAVMACLKPGTLVAGILGGNRSGKTEAGAQIAVAYAMGRNHPAVRLWGHNNGLNLQRIQATPGVVCCSALTSNDSVRVQRDKVLKYLPVGTDWSNRSGHGEATARLPGGGVMLFKSNNQRARAYQGADWHFLWMDEEHDELVFNEARMRLADHAGLALMTMTPLRGRTWVWRRFVEPTQEEYESDCSFYALNSRDNPYVPQWYLEKLLSKYGSHERAARERGEFTALEGRVYEEFSRTLHVVPSFSIPNDWPRYQGWDFGVRNPTAVIWLALDPADDVLHIYREHYKAGWTSKQHAEFVLEIETCPQCEGIPNREDGDPFVHECLEKFDRKEFGYRSFGNIRSPEWQCRACLEHPGRTEPEPEWRVADPAAKGDRKTLSKHHDIRTIPANNEVRPGINSVAERIRLNVAGKPALVIHDNCPNVISEFEGYLWKTNKGKADDPDQPVKANDHAMDAIRYVCHRLARSRGFGATA